MSVFSVRNKSNEDLYEIEIFERKNTEFKKFNSDTIIEVIPNSYIKGLFLFLLSLEKEQQLKFIQDFENLTQYNNYWLVMQTIELKIIPYDLKEVKQIIKSTLEKFCEKYNLIFNED